jgi:hypothetical protein
MKPRSFILLILYLAFLTGCGEQITTPVDSELNQKKI